MALKADSQVIPVDDAIRSVGSSIMRVGHDQKFLFSNCKELPIHSTKYKSRMLSLSSRMKIISVNI